MAPNLSISKREKLQKLVLAGNLKDVAIAKEIPCSVRTVVSVRSNLKMFGTTTAPYNGCGRPPSVPEHMAMALLEHLIIKQHLYVDEMADYFWDYFETVVSADSIYRLLHKKEWSNKTARRIAQQRCPELRSACRKELSEFCSFQLVFVDESGCDERNGFRRTGWAPLGITPHQTARLQRGERHQILPAYSQDGMVYARVFTGSTDTLVFEEYIQELLKHCNPYPGKNSVIVMDNAPIHQSERIDELCERAGVKRVFLSPYSPDLNPVEGFFAQLKRYVRRHWKGGQAGQKFGEFLKCSLETVGNNTASAEGHFRNAGLTITYP